jgi:hypothetical protein
MARVSSNALIARPCIAAGLIVRAEFIFFVMCHSMPVEPLGP